MSGYEKPSDTQVNYHKADLTVRDNGDIVWFNPAAQETWEVMMGWEQPIMEKMAEVCVNEGDHVLECGFGMGILATAVQARKPASHTIAETHPQIQPKLAEFASSNPTVRAVNDRWFSLMQEAGRYDVILMDTYADADLHPKFAYFVKQKAKQGSRISWWNWSGGTTDPWMKFYWPDDHIDFYDVNINPPANQYFNRTVYHLPVYTNQKPATGYGVVRQDATIHVNSDDAVPMWQAVKHDTLLTSDVSGKTSTKQRGDKNVFVMKAKGIYTINSNLKATGNQPIIAKRNNTWRDFNVNQLLVGDKLYGVAGNEIEITQIDFDDSDNTIYEICKLGVNYNYFVNGILIGEGGADNA